MAPKPKPSTRTKATKKAPPRRPAKRPAKAASAPPPPVPAAPVQPAFAHPRWSFGAGLVVVLLLLAAAAVIVGALRLRGGDETFKPEAGVPTEASASQLHSFSSSSHPVYWAGPSQGGRLELTRTKEGAVYVRYLPAGVELGDPTAKYLTVATYPVAGAYVTLQRSARTAGAVSFKAPNGATALWRKSKPTSVYLAYPGSDTLVEIYDPSPSRARSLARSSRLRRIP